MSSSPTFQRGARRTIFSPSPDEPSKGTVKRPRVRSRDLPSRPADEEPSCLKKRRASTSSLPSKRRSLIPDNPGAESPVPASSRALDFSADPSRPLDSPVMLLQPHEKERECEGVPGPTRALESPLAVCSRDEVKPEVVSVAEVGVAPVRVSIPDAKRLEDEEDDSPVTPPDRIIQTFPPPSLSLHAPPAPMKLRTTYTRIIPEGELLRITRRLF